jgi:hypothetical protein
MFNLLLERIILGQPGDTHQGIQIEHSTDIYNSLIKFAELQDFNSKFNIVGATAKKREFESKLKSKVFEEIKDRIKFISYKHLSELHTNLYKYYALQKEMNI